MRSNEQEFIFHGKTGKVKPTFKPNTPVILKKSYEDEFDECSDFLKEGEVFLVKECGLTAFSDLNKQELNDRIDDYDYCLIEIVNYMENDNFDCIDAVVKVEDLKPFESREKRKQLFLEKKERDLKKKIRQMKLFYIKKVSK